MRFPDLTGVGGDVKEIEGTIETGQDRFEFSTLNTEPERFKASFKHQGKTSGIKFERRTDDYVNYRGNFGESKVDLKVGTEAMKIEGTIGDIKVSESVSGQVSHPYLTAVGEIGGLEYRENFYLSESGISHSQGKLGNMEIKRNFIKKDDNLTIDGTIGQVEFKEFITYRT